MAAKSFYLLREYKSSYDLAREFLSRYPSSLFRADMMYIAGLNLMMFQKYPEALLSLIEASRLASDTSLSRQVNLMIASVGEQRVGINEKEKLFNADTSRYAKAFLAVLIAGEYANLGNRDRASEYLLRIGIVDSAGEIARRETDVRKKLDASSTLKIGALLPRMDGSAKNVSNEILEGIQFALSEAGRSQGSSVPISLEVRDSDLDSAGQSNQFHELIDDRDVVAIIGPLFSNLAIRLAPLAAKAGIPMISPTATANGIAAVSRYMFQLHPDFSTRGKGMARYAVQNLGFTKVAVLTSSDETSKEVADAFIAEAERLGATVIDRESYGKDTTDIREPLMAIRKKVIGGIPRISFAGTITRDEIAAMLRAGADKDVVMSARKKKEVVDVTRLFGPRGVRIADSLHLAVIPPEEQFTTLEIPATELDGIFVSIATSEELSVVAPQITFCNIRTQLMGSAEWYDPASLDANRRYVNGALFISDTFVDKSDSVYADFEQRFILEKGKAPAKNTLIGYDTMRLILELIAQGARTREQLALALAAVSDFTGFHSTISLNHGRVNSNVNILKYSNGEIRKIWEISVQ